MKSVHEMGGREFDPNTTMKQIGNATLMSVGFQRKTLVYDRPNGMLKFKVSGRYWLTVKLLADDTYGVEVGKFRKLDYTPIEQELDVHARELAQVVRKLGDRE
jgi:hypothetical protein